MNVLLNCSFNSVEFLIGDKLLYMYRVCVSSEKFSLIKPVSTTTVAQIEILWATHLPFLAQCH